MNDKVRHRILVIEDDDSLLSQISSIVSSVGYKVQGCRLLSEGEKLIASEKPHLVILDWNLPNGEGVDLLKSLRKKDDWTPILFLTARAELIDKVLGLELGANDYLTKPFDKRELLARIQVQLRGNKKETQSVLVHGSLEMNLAERKIFRSGTEIELKKMEFDLLKFFMENPGKVFSRDELLNRVWGFDHFPTTRTVDAHILQLRQKIDDGLFETLRGVGYRLKAV